MKEKQVKTNKENTQQKKLMAHGHTRRRTPFGRSLFDGAARYAALRLASEKKEKKKEKERKKKEEK